MADKTIQEILQAELSSVRLPDGLELDIMTSKQLIDRILPIMTVLSRTQVEETQKVRDAGIMSITGLIEKMLMPSSDLPDIQYVIDELWKGNFQGKWVDEIFRSLASNWIVGPLFSIVMAGIHVSTTVYNHAAVSAEKTRQTANETIRPYLLDLGTLTREYYRHPNSQSDIMKEMRKLGIADHKITTYLDNARQFLDISTLARLWHREEISEKALDQGLRDNLIHPDDIKTIKPALFSYPGVQDLVTMAVREVFSPELAGELGLFSDMPPEFIEEAKKVGLPEKYARFYWGSHWRTASVNQYFEMFHRGIIDREKLEKYLRINDIMPNQREELVEISYRPILRIDLRRMYRSGLIEFEQLVKGNMDLGYSRENAEMISIWTDEEYANENKEITKSDIVSLYNLGHFSFQDAYEALIDTGYNEFSGNDILLKEDLKAAEKEQARVKKIYKKAYLLDTMETSDISAKLLSAGLESKEINEIIAEWDVEYKEKIKYLTATQIEKLYKNDVWGNDQSNDYMIKIGYSEYDSTSLLTLWDIEKQPTEG